MISKKLIWTMALVVSLQCSVTAYSAPIKPATPVKTPSAKNIIPKPPERATPAWVERGLNDLATAGLVTLPPGGTARMSREGMALLVARISVDKVAEAPSMTKKDVAGEYEGILAEMGNVTRKIAKLEEVERRTPADLTQYKEEYAKAEKELDNWANRLAAAELSAGGSEGTEQVALKYKEALNNFGKVNKKLAEAESGREDRKVYLKELKEQKVSLMSQLRDGAKSLAGQDIPQMKNEKKSYGDGQKKLIYDLQQEFAEELANMGYSDIFASK